MPNPVFYTNASENQPLEVAALDANARVALMEGASAVFSLHDLGGALRFSAPAMVVDPVAGKLRHVWTGLYSLPPVGRYLGRFTVTYTNLEEQHFPSNRYIEIVVMEE